ncbi:hypothetical protein IJH15_03660 [Candidatus Saccharibacteria bacterium]|nr:hypothetical protein [Candidatus Saccharibacteria bacterium]MBR3253298.1 hypothetical protein [Candidatus Saccharibacteria bacterium]
MAKSKQPQKIKPMRVDIDGVTYTCSRKNGRITVRTSRTAKGQNLVAGVYDIAEGVWYNDCGDGSLSRKAKEVIARLMS